MIVFLTSSPSGPLNVPNDGHLLDSQNFFIEELKKHWKEAMKGLIIASFKENHPQNDEMASFFKDCFENANLPISFDILDSRNIQLQIQDYDFIMLSGGHVPTQNAFFHEIQLREQFENYSGVVLGVSAGSMNSADVVYAQPELEGETSPTFNRYLKGLNLTKINIIPHYQMIKDYYLDGLRLFEGISYLDSYQTPLYCLNDGSYIKIENNHTYIYGEAYLIKDGKKQIINTKNNRREL